MIGILMNEWTILLHTSIVYLADHMLSDLRGRVAKEGVMLIMETTVAYIGSDLTSPCVTS